METFEIVFLVLCILNILTSIYLYYREDFEIVQKVSQIVIVWIIPFIGAIGLLIFHRTQDLPVKSNNGKFGGGPSDGTGGVGGDG